MGIEIKSRLTLLDVVVIFFFVQRVKLGVIPAGGAGFEGRKPYNAPAVGPKSLDVLETEARVGLNRGNIVRNFQDRGARGPRAARAVD